ncbi:unnamed protein product [Moneuplotes crassus]|uniref:Cytochrome b5 heme-binding domain-containing protein n=1 Tax=Euplotes crassus TaxID=5936 RepID=A0AAD2D9Y2_EUPCR|nr:unnamed protein product [Moneuplotes crassus]
MENTFDLDEVSKHCTADDIWIAVDGKVYDLSTYKTHPAGTDIIVENAGKDATQEFKDAEHTSMDLEELKKYYIGDLEEKINTDTKSSRKRKPISKPKSSQEVKKNSTERRDFSLVRSVAIDLTILFGIKLLADSI